VVKWLTLLLRITEATGSSLGSESGYHDGGFRGYPQSPQANSSTVP
jgi:hypothetical protein